MKQLYFFLFIVYFIPSFSIAQITINRSDDTSPIGSNILYGCDSIVPTSINIGSPGGNQIWDFTGLRNMYFDSISYLNPSQTPYLSQFPNAVLSIYKETVFEGDAYYYYKSVTTDSITILGYVAQGITTYISGNTTEDVYPFTYGSSRTPKYTETSNFIYDSDSIKTFDYITEMDSNDAWGLVILPGYRTFNALRTKSVLIDSSIDYININGAWVPEISYDTSIVYYWHAKGIGENLVTLVVTANDSITLSQYYLGTSCDVHAKRIIQGILTASDSSVMPSTKVYHIKYYYPNDSLAIIDSTITDVNGNFSFDNTLDSTVSGYVWINPDSANYPGEMPSYFGNSCTIQHSSVVTYSCDSEKQVNLNTIKRGNSSGQYNFAGIINSVTGNPAPKLRIYIVDSANAPIRTTLTDETGYFACTNLALGTYKIMLDKPLIDNSVAPVVTINPSSSSQIQQFRLSATYISLSSVTAVVTASTSDNIKIYPNPASTILNVIINSSSDFSYSILDLSGKIVKEGLAETTINISSIQPGVYIIKIQTLQGTAYKKIVVD